MRRCSGCSACGLVLPHEAHEVGHAPLEARERVFQEPGVNTGSGLGRASPSTAYSQVYMGARIGRSEYQRGELMGVSGDVHLVGVLLERKPVDDHQLDVVVAVGTVVDGAFADAAVG